MMAQRTFDIRRFDTSTAPGMAAAHEAVIDRYAHHDPDCPASGDGDDCLCGFSLAKMALGMAPY